LDFKEGRLGLIVFVEDVRVLGERKGGELDGEKRSVSEELRGSSMVVSTMTGRIVFGDRFERLPVLILLLLRRTDEGVDRLLHVDREYLISRSASIDGIESLDIDLGGDRKESRSSSMLSVLEVLERSLGGGKDRRMSMVASLEDLDLVSSIAGGDCLHSAMSSSLEIRLYAGCLGLDEKFFFTGIFVMARSAATDGVTAFALCGDTAVSELLFRRGGVLRFALGEDGISTGDVPLARSDVGDACLEDVCVIVDVDIFRLCDVNTAACSS
jgi:hypothetical protein